MCTVCFHTHGTIWEGEDNAPNRKMVADGYCGWPAFIEGKKWFCACRAKQDNKE